MLTKKDLEHLAELARIELSAEGGSSSGGKENEQEKLQKDLGAILDHFKELQGVDTENVEPMTGGTELKTIVREDVLATRDKRQETSKLTGKGPEQFPDKKDGYLKVPPVF